MIRTNVHGSIAILTLVLILPVSSVNAEIAACSQTDGRHMLILHGGSTRNPASSDSKWRAEELRPILERGAQTLADGGDALSVVTDSIVAMENNGIFNAGRGAIRNQAGERELDASIMNGADQKAGAVASLRRIKNPILAARHIMEKTENVMFVGPVADVFLQRAGLETATLPPLRRGKHLAAIDNAPFGTVGAVALDRCGNLAAGTSTGGFGSKKPGRVGDSPIIGAGTYANEDVAISATGHGEYFIRYAVAHDIAARVRYAGSTITAAAENAIRELKGHGGYGGVITLDKTGAIGISFSSAGMIRGYAGAGQQPVIAVD